VAWHRPGRLALCRFAQTTLRSGCEDRVVQGSRCRLYVDNLEFDTSDSELYQLFETAGAVSSVRIVRDGDTGVACGFAFVDMTTAAAASNAVTALHESYFHGRVLSVRHARLWPNAMNGFGRQRGNRRWQATTG
jgi:RNA recognition motif-containing protein